jgi:hypothetical protein
MPDASGWLLDTNILLRMSKSDDPHHPMISRELQALVSHGARLCFTSQILGKGGFLTGVRRFSFLILLYRLASLLQQHNAACQ